ncbi:MAG: hypothetical protein N4J56_007935 [Chroococcidiopsis sp. SAG 2025]|uniref:XisI protein n=1 Tax=Chroococcidiopsis sp. SAG 2025 TaxID=171389 RepID=UPI00293727E7|nr:XisI protein [Chroococcidiopsis sp. SAG 2025]MDV2998230.1 hypothetical protein [Chroococcidiopsis sp. SAG 2025]
MDIEQYRQYIRQLLSERRERASDQQNAPEYEVQTVSDTEQDVGWRENKREFGCILHLDIRGGKIWIQNDGTEVGIANQLVELGVPKQDIVLAFHEPTVCHFTGFGTGEINTLESKKIEV